MSRKIAKEELVKKFNELYNKLERVPSRDEIGHREPIKRLYGNYNNFVRELGYIPNFLRTKYDYIQYIKKISIELNKTPSLNDLKKKGMNASSIFNMFGSYNNLLIEAGLTTKERTYTDKTEEELLTDYIQLCNKLDKWATARELESIDIYENRFCSIIEVRKLVVDDNRLNIKDKTIIDRHKLYSDKDIENFIKDAIKIYGHNIKKTEFMNYLKKIKGPSVNTVMKRYKVTSFKKLIETFKD